MSFRTATAIVVLAATTACGQASTSRLSATSTPPAASATQPPDVVPGVPSTNWDSPVVNGIDVSVTQARQVAQASIALRMPALPAKVLKIQATDPSVYPEGLRGYGVLLEFPVNKQFPSGGRLLIEQQPAEAADPEIVRSIAMNGAGYHLGNVLGVEVAFIQPEDRASAIFVHKGVRFNLHGPNLTMPVVELAVGAVIAAGNLP